MTKQVLLDARIFIGATDMSGFGNRIEVGSEWEAKKVTNWRSGKADELLAGLGEVDIEAGGQWDAGDITKPDDSALAGRRAAEPWTFGNDAAADGTSVGGMVYLTKAMRTKDTIWGNLGDVATWSDTAKGVWPLVRGTIGHPIGVPRTASGNGGGWNLGVLSGTQKLYANLHVLSVAGTLPSLIVKVQSDDNSGFTSPVDRITFGTKTGTAGESALFAGPTTDNWWRVTWTITGTTPSFLFLVSLGIE